MLIFHLLHFCTSGPSGTKPHWEPTSLPVYTDYQPTQQFLRRTVLKLLLSLNQEWCFSAHFNNDALLEFYIKAQSQLDPPESSISPITQTTPEPPMTSPFMHEPGGAGGLEDTSRSRWSRLQDAVPVQQQGSGGRQR